MGIIGTMAVGLMSVVFPTATAPAASAAATTPFACTSNADAYLLQGGSSELYRIDLVTGEYDKMFDIAPSEVNAAGFNTLDGYIYASRNNGALYRIGEDGVTDLGPIPGLAERKRVVGDVDPDGHYWTIDGNFYYEIDLAPGSPTYMQTLSSGTIAAPGGGIVEGPDWAWVPGGGDFLYRVMNNPAGESVLVAFDMATGIQTSRGVIAGIPSEAGGIKAGAVYADADGFLYASDNDSGVIYRIDIGAASPTADHFSDGPMSGANDGARCASSPIRIDFGDAPNRYATGIGVNGPRHGILEYDEAAHTSPLMLGALIDAEEQGQQNTTATGDNVAGVNDEDGLVSPAELVRNQANTVTISATNNTAEAAMLLGWLDLNGNGGFDDAELVSATVPENSGTADYQLAFPSLTASGIETFGRFRLVSAVTELAPTGAYRDGEVEDYRFAVEDRTLSVQKTSDFTADTRYGDTVNYAVTVTNTGTVPYTSALPAVLFDDLSGVLDDATFNAGSLTSSGSAPAPVFASPHVSWSGPLAVGASVTVNYSVTLRAAGDGILHNVAWQPATPPPSNGPPPTTPLCVDPADGRDPLTGEPCGTTTENLPRLTVSKSSDIASLPASGGTVTFTVTVTNPGPGAYTASAPAQVTDNLSGVLDDATFGSIIAPASGANFNAATQRLTWSGPLAAGASIAITYTAVYGPNGGGGDHQLINEACIPQSQTAGAPCTSVTVPSAALIMSKTVDPSSGMGVDAGQQVTYTLRFESQGSAPATVNALDDLSGVLDDATFGTITAGAGLSAVRTGNDLVITGEIPGGEARTVSYTVTVSPYAQQSDHVLNNVLSNADGTCQPTGCPETDNPIRHFSVTKVADLTADVAAGDVVRYTIVVVSDGAAPYSAGNPAGFTDDLSDVLDDATYNGDATATSTRSGAVAQPNVADASLTWSGPLVVGEQVTVTYSVTVTNNGDHRLLNAAVPVCASGVPCEPATPPVDIPLAYIVVGKTSDPASGSVLNTGQVVTYTLTFSNSGQAAGPVDSTDNLTGVLDDAALTNGPTVDAAHQASISAAVDAATQRLRITGSLPAGETTTVTYQVTIKPFAERGDNSVRNVLLQDAPPTTDCGSCPEFPPPTTNNPIAHFSVEKVAGETVDVLAGDVVTYTITIINDGASEYTSDNPASFTDDLSDVLDDAAYNGDVVVVSTGAGPVAPASVEDGVLAWSGPLAVDERVTVTYSVTVTDRGDHALRNTAVPVCGDGVICDPPTPVVEILLAYITPFKSSDPASGTGLDAGDVVTYTLTFVNSGLAAGALDATDDLTEVLDDAELTSPPVVDADHAATVTAAFDEDEETIRIEGPLGAGETASVTYQVTINPHGTRGDNIIRNVLTPDLPPFVPAPDCDGDECDPFVPPTTEHPIGELVAEKSVDPASGSTVRPGQEVTYTLTFRSIGKAPVAVNREDVLTEVLDDATVTSAPFASDAAVTVSDIVDDRFSVIGTLEADTVVTVVYTVTIKPDGERRDDRIANALVPSGEDPAEVCEADAVDCTVNYVSNVQVTKSVDPKSGSIVKEGDTLTYTLTFENVGVEPLAAPVEIDYTDHMADVLDDADLVGGPQASDTVIEAVVDGQTIQMTGAVATGESVEVVYTVRVKSFADQGNHVLANVVAVTGEEPICAEGSGLCTDNPVQPPTGLAVTGGQFAWGIALTALVLLLLGGALRFRSRSRVDEVLPD